MRETLLSRDIVVSYVGLSGTGKSLCRRVLQSAVVINGTSAGDMMRAHILQTRGVDLEHFVGNITDEDDLKVDKVTIEWLKREGARTIDGRTPSMFLHHMEKIGVKKLGDSIKVSVVCNPEVRAKRALSKFRKKPGLEDIVVEEVMQLQKQRDDTDTARLISNLKQDNGVNSQKDLYGMPPNDMEIDTAICTPVDAFYLVLLRLLACEAISVQNMPIAYARGVRAINRFTNK